MNTHPYLRAYLAGILIPTLVLPLLLALFIVLRICLHTPVPIEQALVFPMALVPVLWGLWNMLWLVTHMRTHLPIGLHGAILPLLLAPCGTIFATNMGVLKLLMWGLSWFNVVIIPWALIVPFFLAALIGYYLVWKYIVGFVNRVLGIA
jgi:hypothetical protein